MGVSWTTEQQQVIDLRNRNILVSAAAGSGKTAVLVERIVKIITDKNHPVDIDHLLIVMTYFCPLQYTVEVGRMQKYRSCKYFATGSLLSPVTPIA